MPAAALCGGGRGQALGKQVGDGEASGLDHDRGLAAAEAVQEDSPVVGHAHGQLAATPGASGTACAPAVARLLDRSEEHTSELQSLMRISYAVFCLKKKRRYKSVFMIRTYAQYVTKMMTEQQAQ